MTQKNDRYPYFLIMQYTLIYMGMAVYSPFISLYMDSIGFSNTTIGTLMAIGPLVSIFSQPVWGIAADRAKNKNNVLKVLFVGTAVCGILHPVWTNIYYVFAITVLFSCFQTSIVPLNDAITLEYLQTTRWKFGPIRAIGTVSFSIMVAIAGMILNVDINYMFSMILIIFGVNFIVTMKFPQIKGHQSEGNRVPVWELFRDSKLTIYMILSMVIQLGLGFHMSFFPLYFKQIGGDNTLYGWVMFVLAMSEVPLLLFVDRIFSRARIGSIMVIASVFTGVRWVLVYLVKDPYLMLPVSLIHGPTAIAVIYSMVIYINKNVRKELRSTGQTINALVSLVFPRIIAGIFGGMLSDMLGIRTIFLYASVVNFAAALIFGVIFVLIPHFKPQTSTSALN